MKYSYQYRDNSFSFDLNPSGTTWQALYNDQIVEVELIRAEAGQLDFLLDGKPVSAVVSIDRANRWVTVNGQTLLLEQSDPVRKKTLTSAKPTGQLIAPMPGQVRAVQVTEGELVKKGQTLVIVEAMKMEMKITAQFDGWVKMLSVQVGKTVERDQILGVIQESSDPA